MLAPNLSRADRRCSIAFDLLRRSVASRGKDGPGTSTKHPTRAVDPTISVRRCRKRSVNTFPRNRVGKRVEIDRQAITKPFDHTITTCNSDFANLQYSVQCFYAYKEATNSVITTVRGWFGIISSPENATQVNGETHQEQASGVCMLFPLTINA